jgi:hypothetical protein
MTQGPDRFKNRRQAYLWIAAQGAGLSERSFYDAVSSGFPSLAPDKTLARWEVSEFLRQHERKTASAPPAPAARADAETRRAIAQADREEMKRDQERREMSNAWVRREDAELELCAITALLRDLIINRITRAIPAIIQAAGGDQAHLADVDEVIDSEILAACNDLAQQDEIDIEFS